MHHRSEVQIRDDPRSAGAEDLRSRMDSSPPVSLSKRHQPTAPGQPGMRRDNTVVSVSTVSSSTSSRNSDPRQPSSFHRQSATSAVSSSQHSGAVYASRRLSPGSESAVSSSTTSGSGNLRSGSTILGGGYIVFLYISCQFGSRFSTFATRNNIFFDFLTVSRCA
nr:uncharacterized protein LOC115260602 [Aedes albopictus]